MDNFTLSYTLILVAALPRSNKNYKQHTEIRYCAIQNDNIGSESPFSYNFIMRLRVYLPINRTKVLKVKN